MKKMLKVMTIFTVLTLLLTMVTGTVFAAGSKSDVVEVEAKADGADVELSYADASVELTAKIAASKIDGAKEEEMDVIWQKDITSKTLPVDLTFKVSLDKGQEGYVYHYTGGDWKLVGKVNASITFSSLSPVGVAVRTVSSDSSGGDTSPKTGDSGLLLSLASFAIVMGGAVAGISFRKKD